MYIQQCKIQWYLDGVQDTRIRILEANLHILGGKRLYLVPSFRIRVPTMTKFAARMNVGLMIVVVILGPRSKLRLGMAILQRMTLTA